MGAASYHRHIMTSMPRHALLIGNSDGIGLHTTRRLLDRGWQITGVSRRESPIVHASYRHHVLDVTDRDYVEKLRAIVGQDSVDTCIYCAGIGCPVDPRNLRQDVQVFDVNLMGALRTAEVIVPAMVAAGRGHFVALSSQSDVLVVARAPSYPASKAAMSGYFEGLGLAVRQHGVAVSNLRLGFVDTKMARGLVRPFMYTLDQAVDVVEDVLAKRCLRFTRPFSMAVVVGVLAWISRWRVFFTRGPNAPRV
jgi:NAD(P)-dependent dehydrogenase (short-subunit alcohol dehydrogenase family)